MTNKLLFLLSKAEHTLKTHFNKRINEEGIQVSPGQSGILFLLKRRNSQKMSELSKGLGIDNSAITRLVDRLERQNLVIRKPNPDDRRQFLISITEKGSDTATRMGSIANGINDKIKEGFTTDEIDVFIRILNTFNDKFK